jgi:hypothetical protein
MLVNLPIRTIQGGCALSVVWLHAEMDNVIDHVCITFERLKQRGDTTGLCQTGSNHVFWGAQLIAHKAHKSGGFGAIDHAMIIGQ